MNEEYVGTVALFPYKLVPAFYVPCDGRLLSVVQYAQLFSVLGNAFGGNGTTNFALPNLNFTVPVGAGAGQRGINVPFGESAGEDTVKLSESNLAAHTHPVSGEVYIGGTSQDDADSSSPKDSFLRTTPGINTYAGSHNAPLGAATAFEVSFNNKGEGTEINNIQPTIGMGYYICSRGVIPAPELKNI